MDEEYFDDQKKFIQSLSEEEIRYLKAYTQVGFYFISEFNPFQPTSEMLEKGMEIIEFLIAARNKRQAIFNMFHPTVLDTILPEDLPKLSIEYAHKIAEIIKKAPKTKRMYKLYRGQRDQKYDPLKAGLLMSTTYRTDWKDFPKFVGETCCLLEITLYPGVPTIALSNISVYSTDQYEIVIAPNAVNIQCSVKEVRKQKIGDKMISVFDCQITPKDYNPLVPVKSITPIRVGGKTRKQRKSRKSKNQRAR